MNKAKVDVGQSPPLDLAVGAGRGGGQPGAADRRRDGRAAGRGSAAPADLRRDRSRASGSIRSNPVDSPPIGMTALDVDAAVTNALRDRADLHARAARHRERDRPAERSPATSGCPTCALNASYQASGLGGTEVLRTGGFPGTIVGAGDGTAFGTVLDQLFRSDYPTWAVGRERVLSDRPERRRGQLRAEPARARAGRASASRAPRRASSSRCATPAGRSR